MHNKKSLVFLIFRPLEFYQEANFYFVDISYSNFNSLFCWYSNTVQIFDEFLNTIDTWKFFYVRMFALFSIES